MNFFEENLLNFCRLRNIAILMNIIVSDFFKETFSTLAGWEILMKIIVIAEEEKKLGEKPAQLLQEGHLGRLLEDHLRRQRADETNCDSHRPPSLNSEKEHVEAETGI